MNEFLLTALGLTVGIVSSWGKEIITNKPKENDNATKRMDSVMDNMHVFNQTVKEDRDRLAEEVKELKKENRCLRDRIHELERR